MKNYLLELVVFICGAMVMVLELTGSRVVAPYLGTSLIVWTSLIGIVLASLSLGYWWGGKLADKDPNPQKLGLIILAAGVYVLGITLVKESFLNSVQSSFQDLRWQTVYAAFVLFAVPSTLLGMVSPYAVRLKLKQVSESGKTVGNLYAISTIGSIVGTFSAGFILMSYLGNTNVLLLTAGMLCAISLPLLWPKWLPVGVVAILFLVSSYGLNHYRTARAEAGFIDVDTAYSRVHIFDQPFGPLTVRHMNVSNELSSAMFLESNELVYTYTKRYNLGEFFVPNFKSALLIGGAAYSYPKEFLRRYPEATIDVVEIDPELTELARTYFRLTDSPNLGIIHEDGRTYLNRTDKKYDLMYGDAFLSRSIPFQLTTREAFQEVHDLLSDNGVALLNTITALEGEKSLFLQAEYATLRSIFPHVYIFPVGGSQNPEELRNVMVVASKNPVEPDWTGAKGELATYVGERWIPTYTDLPPVLTDDFAPVDRYSQAIHIH